MYLPGTWTYLYVSSRYMDVFIYIFQVHARTYMYMQVHAHLHGSTRSDYPPWGSVCDGEWRRSVAMAKPCGCGYGCACGERAGEERRSNTPPPSYRILHSGTNRYFASTHQFSLAWWILRDGLIESSPRREICRSMGPVLQCSIPLMREIPQIQGEAGRDPVFEAGEKGKGKREKGQGKGKGKMHNVHSCINSSVRSDGSTEYMSSRTLSLGNRHGRANNT